MAFTRISMTLPRDVLVAADRRARALDRSRSWLIVEAIRAYLSESPSRVRESPSTHYGVASPGLGPLRLAQLESDLRLTPERRVQAAEESARLGELVRKSHGRRQQVLSFERYEDYVAWKRIEQAAP